MISKSGSALVETVFTISFCSFAFVLALNIILFVGTKIILDHILYESLVCVKENESIKNCQISAKKKIQKTLIFGKLQTLNLFKKANLLNAKIKYDMFFVVKPHSINFELKLMEPL